MDSCDKGRRAGAYWQKEKSKNSQGMDPKTFQGNSQGRDPSTLERNSQGEDPSIFKDLVEKWQDQEKRKEQKWKKRRKRKKKKKKEKKKEMVIISLYMMRMKKGREERRKAKEVKDAPKRDKLWGNSGSGLFILLLLGQNWLRAIAAAEGLQRRTEAMVRMQQEVQVNGSRWAEESSRWKQPNREDRAEMKKRSKAAEMYLAKWISVEHREEVHEKIQWKVRRLLWNRT